DQSRGRRSKQERRAAKLSHGDETRSGSEGQRDDEAGWGALGAGDDLRADMAEDRRGRRRRRLTSPVTAALIADDELGAVRLFTNLQSVFGAAGFELKPRPENPDLLIH